MKLLDYFGSLWVLSASVISSLMPLSVSFLETQVLVCSIWDACARELIRTRFLFHVSSYCVSRNASVEVAQRGLLVDCRNLPVTCFSFKCLALAVLKKLNTERASIKLYLL